MKENNEKIENLKIMLTQNNDTSNKTKFLLKQVSTDFLKKFFDNNVKESEKINNDSEKICPYNQYVFDNHGKSFQVYINLGDSYFESLKLVFATENINEYEEIIIDICNEQNKYNKPKLAKMVDNSTLSKFTNSNLTTQNISIQHLTRKEQKYLSLRKLNFLELFKDQQKNNVLITVCETSKYLKSNQTESKKTNIDVKFIKEKEK